MIRSREYVSRLDFNSQLFDSTMGYCFGKRILNQAQELKRSQAFQQKLARNFNVSDRVADELASKMREGAVTREDYALTVSRGLGAVDNPSPALKAFIHSAENIPAFIDRDKVEQGGKVFRTKLDIPGLMLYGFPVSIYNQGFVPSITLALLFSMQPEDNPETILETLAKKSCKQRGSVRLLETFKWFGKVSEQGAGQLYSPSYIENCRIRLVHAHIRAAINHRKENWNFSPSVSWRTDELGVPLCAADSSIVVSSVVAAIYSMRWHLKKHITRSELEALNHWANYVSYLQGVPEDLLCHSAEETVAHFAAFMMSMNTQTYHSELASFIESLQRLHMERALFRNSKPMQFVLKGLTQAIVDEIFSADIKAHYHIEQAPLWANSLLKASKIGIASVNLLSGRSQLVNQLVEGNADFLWREFIPEAEKTFSAYYGSVVS